MLVPITKEEFITCFSKAATGLVKKWMCTCHIYVLLGFRHPTELAQRSIDAGVGRGTLREICRMRHPIKGCFEREAGYRGDLFVALVSVASSGIQ
jgi:hypothetical protein